MKHLETITIPLNKLNPTFHWLSATWEPYLETWRMVDEGNVKPRDTPLFNLMMEHYAPKTRERLEREKQLLQIHSSEADVISEEWVRRHIELYNSIKKRGYTPNRRAKPITVNIRDDGSYGLMDGTHTVSILIHLGHSEIEAWVKERKSGWNNLKNGLHSIYGEKKLYQPVEHPDFADWKIERTETHRERVIFDALKDLNGKQVVDIGSCTGYISERLADMGADVTGLEPNQIRCDASNTFADYHEYPEDNPVFLQEPFESHLKENRYDVAVVLSVLHHYLRRGLTAFMDAVELISESCESMVLEMGVNNLPVEWNPELVTEYSKYSEYSVLYGGERPIYLYEK